MGFFDFGKKKQQDAWRFPVAANTTVLTTSLVLEGKPVTHVSHDSDGEWQFHSDDEHPDLTAVARIAGLGQMIELDPSLMDLAGLPRGMEVTRTCVGEQWKARKLEEE